MTLSELAALETDASVREAFASRAPGAPDAGPFLRLARTLADLDGAEAIGADHLLGAIRLRGPAAWEPPAHDAGDACRSSHGSAVRPSGDRPRRGRRTEEER